MVLVVVAAEETGAAASFPVFSSVECFPAARPFRPRLLTASAAASGSFYDVNKTERAFSVSASGGDGGVLRQLLESLSPLLVGLSL